MLYAYRCSCGFLGSIERSMKDDIPQTWVCPECGKDMNRDYSSIGVVFKGEGWPSKDIKRANEDQKMFTKARIARRLKASGAVPMEERIDAKDVDENKFHGDLTKKEFDAKRCDYDGLKPHKRRKKDD